MPIVILFIYLAALAGLVFFIYLRPAYFRLLPVLLICTAANETWLTLLHHKAYRGELYNLFSLIEMIVWWIILSRANQYRSWSYWLLAALLVASLIEIFRAPGHLHTISYRAFSLFVIAACIQYFYRLTGLQRETSIRRDGPFWIFAGLFIFQVVFAFYLTALDFPAFVKAPDAGIAFRKVFDMINIIYYILITYGLSCFYFYRRS